MDQHRRPLRLTLYYFTRRRGVRGEMMLELDEITGVVIDCSVHIHKDLGPGLLESVYEVVLARQLQQRGFSVERQKPVSFVYGGIQFDEGFRADLVIDGRVIIELKSIDKLAPVHAKQLLTYLRLMKLSVGLLINFGSATLKDGLRRIVNQLPESPTEAAKLRINRPGAQQSPRTPRLRAN